MSSEPFAQLQRIEGPLTMGEVGQVAAKLLEVLNGNKCIGWIGSGLSIPEYPGWEKVLDTLCSACEVRKTEANASNFTVLADECKLNNPAAYERVLANEFGKPVNWDRRAYSLLAQLPFKAYVTTNYDPLLRDAADARGFGFSQYPLLVARHIETKQSHAFYIHGLARDDHDRPCGKNLILAESEFEEAYREGGATSMFVHSVLMSYDLFFIGCSLAEPAIQDCFERIHALHEQIKVSHPGVGLPRRMMLLPHKTELETTTGISRRLPAPSAEKEEQAKYEKLGIVIVRYKTTEQDGHIAVTKILDRALQLSGALAPKTPDLSL